MTTYFIKFLALLTIVTPLSLGAEILSIGSPDGRNRVSFEKPGKELTYTIDRDGKQLILPSRAGLHVDNRVWEMALGKRDLAQPDCWMDLLEVDSVSYHAPVDSTWHPLYGERSTVTAIIRPLCTCRATTRATTALM